MPYSRCQFAIPGYHLKNTPRSFSSKGLPSTLYTDPAYQSENIQFSH